MSDQKQPTCLLHQQRYTLDEAAGLVDCNPKTLRRAINAGELVAYLIGKKIRITEAALNDWLESRRMKPRRRVGQRRSRDMRGFSLRDR